MVEGFYRRNVPLDSSLPALAAKVISYIPARIKDTFTTPSCVCHFNER